MKFTYLLLFIACIAQSTPHFLLKNNDRARAIINSLTLEEKIGQLFMVAARSDGTSDPLDAFMSGEGMDIESVSRYITEYHVGGIIFLGISSITEQKVITSFYQTLPTSLPLLIGQDLEWGLAMRFFDARSYPRAMTLGAIKDRALVEKIGHAIGCEARALGVHINFSPVVDVNSNPNNPIIHMRSFGDSPERVALHATAFMAGMQSSGIFTCAKHFPGHGDTAIDSHRALPVLRQSRDELESIDLLPFRTMIQNNVESIMLGHLAVPSLTASPNQPATFSKEIVTDLLKKQYHFDGLIITDALNMHAVTDSYSPAEIAQNSFLAEAHILLSPKDVIPSIEGIKQLLIDGIITEDDIDQRIMPIIQTKLWFATDDTNPDHTLNADDLIQEAYDHAITALGDTSIIPLNSTQFYVSISCDDAHVLPVQKNIVHYSINDFYIENLTHDDVVIIEIKLPHYRLAEQCGLDKDLINKINQITKSHPNTILIVYGSPYCASWFTDFTTMIIAYENNRYTQQSVQSILYGNKEAIGTLPIYTMQQ